MNNFFILFFIEIFFISSLRSQVTQSTSISIKELYPQKIKMGNSSFIVFKEFKNIENSILLKVERKNDSFVFQNWGKFESALDIDVFNNKVATLSLDNKGINLSVYENTKDKLFKIDSFNIQNEDANGLSFIDSSNVLIYRTYNFYVENQRFNNLGLFVYNLPSKKIIFQKKIDIGVQILYSYLGYDWITTHNNLIYIAISEQKVILKLNNELNIIDTIRLANGMHHFTDNTTFSDSYIDSFKSDPKKIMSDFFDNKLSINEHIEDVKILDKNILKINLYSQLGKRVMLYNIENKKVILDSIIKKQSLLYSGKLVGIMDSIIFSFSKSKSIETDYWYIASEKFDGVSSIESNVEKKVFENIGHKVVNDTIKQKDLFFDIKTGSLLKVGLLKKMNLIDVDGNKINNYDQYDYVLFADEYICESCIAKIDKRKLLVVLCEKDFSPNIKERKFSQQLYKTKIDVNQFFYSKKIEIDKEVRNKPIKIIN